MLISVPLLKVSKFSTVFIAYANMSHITQILTFIMPCFPPSLTVEAPHQRAVHP